MFLFIFYTNPRTQNLRLKLIDWDKKSVSIYYMEFGGVGTIKR